MSVSMRCDAEVPNCRSTEMLKCLNSDSRSGKAANYRKKTLYGAPLLHVTSVSSSLSDSCKSASSKGCSNFLPALGASMVAPSEASELRSKPSAASLLLSDRVRSSASSSTALPRPSSFDSPSFISLTGPADADPVSPRLPTPSPSDSLKLLSRRLLTYASGSFLSPCASSSSFPFVLLLSSSLVSWLSRLAQERGRAVPAEDARSAALLASPGETSP
mmetsp:Transcript_13333/g.49516  ORF Transcript_13333/g.49516 Transcript_13333/m.49516 type:complete len:218 (-) Transcript_13333:340-993(-)